MLFSIIYDCRMPVTVPLNRFRPAFRRKARWELTERDYEVEEPWKERQRKYACMLNRLQFHQFICQLGLYAESQTMGSLGAPGFGMGMAPAVSFGPENYDPEVYLNAYVTPVTKLVMGIEEDDPYFQELELKDNDPEDLLETCENWTELEEELMEFYSEKDFRENCHEWNLAYWQRQEARKRKELADAENEARQGRLF